MPKSTKSTTRTKPSKKVAKSKTTASGTSKLSQVLDRLRSANGASLADLEKLTGWQPHSIRAALTGLRKQKIEITRSKSSDGITIYSAAKA